MAGISAPVHRRRVLRSFELAPIEQQPEFAWLPSLPDVHLRMNLREQKQFEGYYIRYFVKARRFRSASPQNLGWADPRSEFVEIP